QLELLRQFGRYRLNRHAEVTARDLSVGDNTFHHVTRQVDGDGEADSLVATTAADDGLIDADQPAFNVHQCTTGIAGIDRRIGLDEILVIHNAHPAAALGADDAGGDGLADTEGIADGQHGVAHFEQVAVGDRNGREFVGVHFDDG